MGGPLGKTRSTGRGIEDASNEMGAFTVVRGNRTRRPPGCSRPIRISRSFRAKKFRGDHAGSADTRRLIGRQRQFPQFISKNEHAQHCTLTLLLWCHLSQRLLVVEVLPTPRRAGSPGLYIADARKSGAPRATGRRQHLHNQQPLAQVAPQGVGVSVQCWACSFLLMN